MQEFVPTIIALRNSKPDELITELHKMFRVISSLDANGVVVAFQTVSTTAAAMNLQHDRMIQALLNALAAQMHAIAETSAGHNQKKRFKAVAGEIYEPNPFGSLGVGLLR